MSILPVSVPGLQTGRIRRPEKAVLPARGLVEYKGGQQTPIEWLQNPRTLPAALPALESPVAAVVVLPSLPASQIDDWI